MAAGSSNKSGREADVEADLYLRSRRGRHLRSSLHPVTREGCAHRCDGRRPACSGLRRNRSGTSRRGASEYRRTDPRKTQLSSCSPDQRRLAARARPAHQYNRRGPQRTRGAHGGTAGRSVRPPASLPRAPAGGKPRFVADYYVSSGKNGPLKVREGDEKTPIGVYHVTASLPREELSDFYGSGAFPINYPNEWYRIQGRNGHGIWLHGTPSNTYSRPPRSSNGCVVLANSDLDALAGKLQIGVTPVIISE